MYKMVKMVELIDIIFMIINEYIDKQYYEHKHYKHHLYDVKQVGYWSETAITKDVMPEEVTIKTSELVDMLKQMMEHTKEQLLIVRKDFIIFFDAQNGERNTEIILN